MGPFEIGGRNRTRTCSTHVSRYGQQMSGAPQGPRHGGQRDPRWDQLAAARTGILAAVGPLGIDHLEFIAAFPDPRFQVWLGTSTDAQREQLGIDLVDPDTLPEASRRTVPKRAKPNVVELVRQHLANVGFRGSELDTVTVMVQSHETVDRDYESSWYLAMR